MKDFLFKVLGVNWIHNSKTKHIMINRFGIISLIIFIILFSLLIIIDKYLL